MPGHNGALVPGPGDNHSSAQNNQVLDNELANQSSGQGNLGRGFDQGNMGQNFQQGNLGRGFDSNNGSGSTASGYSSGEWTCESHFIALTSYLAIFVTGWNCANRYY